MENSPKSDVDLDFGERRFEDLEPEALDALSELAADWGVDIAEAYRRMIQIAKDPERIRVVFAFDAVDLRLRPVDLN